MAKSFFYTVWTRDESQSSGERFDVLTRVELVSFLRSGQDFIAIEPFDRKTVFEHFITSEPDKPTNFNLNIEEKFHV